MKGRVRRVTVLFFIPSWWQLFRRPEVYLYFSGTYYLLDGTHIEQQRPPFGKKPSCQYHMGVDGRTAILLRTYLDQEGPKSNDRWHIIKWLAYRATNSPQLLERHLDTFNDVLSFLESRHKKKHV